jgi:hypothetical protein
MRRQARYYKKWSSSGKSLRPPREHQNGFVI